MKRIILLPLLFTIAACSSLPSGVYDAKHQAQADESIRIVSNKSKNKQGSEDALFGLYDNKNKRWLYPLEYKHIYKFKHEPIKLPRRRNGGLNPVLFSAQESYAFQKSDLTWEVIRSGKRTPISDKLTSFDCSGYSICVGRDQEGFEYRYEVAPAQHLDNPVESFKLISKGKFQWEKTKDGYYRTPGKEEGLYFYRFGKEFRTPTKNHIGTALSYDLGRGNRKELTYHPVIIDIFKVNGQRLYGLGWGEHAKPICKNIELHVFAGKPGDGKAKRANFICEHINGNYVSFSKFYKGIGGNRFLETGSVVKWLEAASKTEAIAKSEPLWDEAIKMDFANVAKDLERDRKQAAYAAAKDEQMLAYGEELFNKGVRSRSKYLPGWCESKGLNSFDCADAHKAAENHYYRWKRQDRKSWKDIDRNVYNTRNGTGGTSSGFDASAAAYARKQEMKRFQQSMDYISGRSTYNPDASYRQNR